MQFCGRRKSGLTVWYKYFTLGHFPVHLCPASPIVNIMMLFKSLLALGSVASVLGQVHQDHHGGGAPAAAPGSYLAYLTGGFKNPLYQQQQQLTGGVDARQGPPQMDGVSAATISVRSKLGYFTDCMPFSQFTRACCGTELVS